jgi:CheY-like chemotaxis protein
MHVLLVEPDTEVRQTLAGCLGGRGYDVVAPPTATEAITWCKKHASPDVVMVDLLPDRIRLNELLAAIHDRTHRRPPVIFVSRTPRRINRVGSIGPVVTPPFDVVRVLAAVDEALLEQEVRRMSGRGRPTRALWGRRRRNTRTSAETQPSGADAPDLWEPLRQLGLRDDAIADWISKFAEAHGRRPQTAEEFVMWLGARWRQASV